jgi:HipA-like protein
MLLLATQVASVAVIAIQHIRRMRGGAQSHLMLASDNHLYVVKFRNNPQHVRVLANELLATRLATAVGLAVPPCEVIEVTEWLIQNTPDLTIEQRGGAQPCQAGLHFASRWVGGLMPGQTVDYLPQEQLLEVRNLGEFAGILALDKWTCNINGRQAVFQKGRRERRYKATFIDQGYCFHAGDWKFIDISMGGVFAENTVYRGVTCWDSFEPWLSRIENLTAETAWGIAEMIPPEWYGGDLSALEVLVERLLVRRERVRELIVAFRESARQPFPNWGAEREKRKGGGEGGWEWVQDEGCGSGVE